MKQFKTIFKFELKNYFQSKPFIFTTIIIMLVIAGIILFPSVKALFTDDKPADGNQNAAVSEEGAEDRPVMYVISEDEGISEAFKAAFTGYDVRTPDEDTGWVKKQIKEEKAECAFEIKDLTSYTYYVNDLGMYDMNTETANAVLKNYYGISALAEKGIAPEEAAGIINYQVDSKVEKLGKDQMSSFFYAYIMVFALYMMILLYGQMIASGVASEKSSRAMELLITSAKPESMIFGKVTASCLAGIAQVVTIFGFAILMFRAAGKEWGDNPIVSSIFDIPPELLAYMLVFFILGFLIYSFLFGAAGSLVSKLEEINIVVTPVIMTFLVGFLIVVFSMSSGSVDNIVMKICSFVPLTSPMAMFARIAMSTVPGYETAISIGLLVLFVFLTGVAGARIYKAGVLLYGNKPGPLSIIKALKSSKKTA